MTANYRMPTDATRLWVLATIADAVDTAYDAHRRGLSRREPSLTVAVIADDLRQRHSDEWSGWSRNRQASSVRTALRGLTRANILECSTGEGESGRDAKMWNPGTEWDAGHAMIVEGARAARRAARSVEMARELANDRLYDAARGDRAQYVDYVDSVDAQGRPSAVAVKETMFSVAGITRHLEDAGFGQVEGVDVTDRKDLTRLGLGVTIECEVTWVDHPA